MLICQNGKVALSAEYIQAVSVEGKRVIVFQDGDNPIPVAEYKTETDAESAFAELIAALDGSIWGMDGRWVKSDGISVRLL